MTPPLRIGLAGLGTVGGGVARLLHENAELIAARAGRAVVVTAASALEKSIYDALPLKHARFEEDARVLASAPDVDVVVELIGGSEGIARGLVEASLSAGKHVVTANKALLAHHGLALTSLAEKKQVQLAFEAAVAGGIPVLKAIRESLAANRITRVMGILNGTCNYILTEMWAHKKPFDTVLAEAQKLGYAEANPSFDVDGIDTAHKTALLSALSFGHAPALDQVQVHGIRAITLDDMARAEAEGFRIKLLGMATHADGKILQRVVPCRVPLASPLAQVSSVFNGVLVQGDAVGDVFFQGRGAGAAATASAVAGDLIDIARGVRYNPFGGPARTLATPAVYACAAPTGVEDFSNA